MLEKNAFFLPACSTLGQVHIWKRQEMAVSLIVSFQMVNTLGFALMRATKGLHVTEPHHSFSPKTPPNPCAIMCGSTNLDTPGWVGSLWMGQTHWLTSVPEEQLQPFVLKYQSYDQQQWFHFPSYIIAQFTVYPPASGRLMLFSGIQFPFIWASFRLWPLKKSANALIRNWSQSDGVSKSYCPHVLLFSPVKPMLVSISKAGISLLYSLGRG